VKLRLQMSPVTRSFWCVVQCVVVYSLAVATAAAQPSVVRNPLEGNRDAIASGGSIFREVCATCHGIDAKGVRGQDLTALWLNGFTDERVFQTIRRGVPGTEMPPISQSENAIWSVVAYLRSINATAESPAAAGNIAKGEQQFTRVCAGCHRAGERGGRLGPNLSIIGTRRSRAALKSKIRNAEAYLSMGDGPGIWRSMSTEPVSPYRVIALVTRSGEWVRGLVKNEDAFSIQIMDTSERLRGFVKSALASMTWEQGTLMPSFPPARLSDGDLDDLVAYLSTLRRKEQQ